MADKAILLALAERAEKASAGQQCDLIGDAWDAIGPTMCPTEEQAARFARMIDAEAYESAAIMLVPEGHWWDLCHFLDEQGTFVRAHCGTLSAPTIIAATPALALAAAALRAQSTVGES